MTSSARRRSAASSSNLTPTPGYPDIRPELRVLANSGKQNWRDIFIASYWLAPQPVFVTSPQGNAHLIQFSLNGACNLSAKIDGRTNHAFVGPGSIFIEPHGTAVSTCWDRAVSVCHLHLAPQALVTAAGEVGRGDPDRVELLWQLGAPDPLTEQIGLALLGELQTQNPLGQLYVESLTQTLALHLLYRYSTASRLREAPTDGLSSHQLNLVLEYINAHLETNIALATLAQLVDLSPTYFARRFDWRPASHPINM